MVRLTHRQNLDAAYRFLRGLGTRWKCMMSEIEVSAQCPYCFSPISFVCEFLSGPQAYIEDCEVCCRPIQISYQTREEDEDGADENQDDENGGGRIIGFEVSRLDG